MTMPVRTMCFVRIILRTALAVDDDFVPAAVYYTSSKPTIRPSERVSAGLFGV